MVASRTWSTPIPPSSTTPPHFLLPSRYSLPPPSPHPLSPFVVSMCWGDGGALKKKKTLSSFFLLLLSHELSLSSSRRFNVDLVAILFFCCCCCLFLCLSDVMDVFYRIFSMCLLSLSLLSLLKVVSYLETAPQTDSNSHVPLLLHSSTSTSTPPCLTSPRPGLS